MSEIEAMLMRELGWGTSENGYRQPSDDSRLQVGAEAIAAYKRWAYQRDREAALETRKVTEAMIEEEGRLSEYVICQRRGHSSSGRSFSNARHTWTYCKWCNTPYRWTEPQMVED